MEIASETVKHRIAFDRKFSNFITAVVYWHFYRIHTKCFRLNLFYLIKLILYIHLCLDGRMGECKQSLWISQFRSVAKVNNIRHFERREIRFVSLATGSHFVVQFGRLNGSQKGSVTRRNADTIVWK